MNTFTWFHIVMGSIALIAGATALMAKKGGFIHRRSGMFFVVSMLFMSASGAIIAAIVPVRISVPAGLLAFYLVLTSLLTVRQVGVTNRHADMVAMLLGLITAISGAIYGWMALQTAKGALDGYPAQVYFIFGSIAFIAVVLDVKLLLNGGTSKMKGKHRIARHLWRMCFAMYIVTSAFFLGQAKHFPEALRITWLLSIPVFIVLLLMIFWLVRTLWTRRAAPKAT